MSLMPSISLGFWNAWILMLFVPLQPVILKLVDKLVGTGEIYKKMGEEPTDITQKRLNTFITLLLYALVVFSIFVPLKLGTTWLYAGLVIYLVGFIIFLAAIVVAARTPPGELFVRGIYRYSRHPLYLSFAIILFGVSVASASWLFLLFSTVCIYLTLSQAPNEEQACLVVFDGAYRDYMETTPRWIGFPKIR